jgi:hypothetical protein
VSEQLFDVHSAVEDAANFAPLLDPKTQVT